MTAPRGRWHSPPMMMFRMLVAVAVTALHPGGAAADGPAHPPHGLALAEDTAAPGPGADPNELECLALTVYFESRGEPAEGQAAVAHVALNRASAPSYPDSVCRVVQQGGKTPPCQFGWWCDGVPNAPTDAVAWSQAQQIARTVLAGQRADPTGGALYFYSTTLDPAWARRKVAARVIGRHVFFRLPGSEDGEHAGDQRMADNVALVEADDGDTR